MSPLTVSQLASRAAISADTVRYYERIGLLGPAERSPSGYRLFTEEAADRLLFIRSAQRFGLRLEAIGELLDIRDRGLCPCGHTRELLEARLAEIDRERESLNRLRAEVEEILRGAPRSGGNGSPCQTDLMQIQRRSAT
ncbi:MAG: MerR family DNA-binding protein [Acidimicrobiales bacterium]